MSQTPAQTGVASETTLERNLAAIARSCPAAAQAVRGATEHDGLEFVPTADGLGSAVLTAEGKSAALASKRRPGDEANRLANEHDLAGSPVVAVLGFGVGHHAGAVCERLGNTGVTLIYEPDVCLLRWVLARFDHSKWLSAGTTRLLLNEGDRGELASSLRGAEGLSAMGVQILEHAPSRARLGKRGAEFGKTLASVMRAIRTNVATTLVHSGITLRNQLMNLAAYASVEGIAPLKDAARGSPAVVVSAGPSLARNVDLLSAPGVRDRVVIIAVQTVLKTLLDRGIRPHFVTALDHHEISKRFYEGLSESDVEGITLVAEAKSNSAILDAYPGAIRCPGDQALDALLGIDPLPTGESAKGSVPAGATVAHLAYYLARYLGCDPVALIGQDLAFTDGQYYAPGAAIHRVWGPELGEFRTLEMLEWERIVRMNAQLHRVKDHLGRDVYSDEQMQTYLTQFERDFTQDAAAGLTTIDATEGGVIKRAAAPRPLASCLEMWRDAPLLNLPGATAPSAPTEKLKKRVRDVRQSAWRVVRGSREAADLLSGMLDHDGDTGRLNTMITEVHAVRDRVKRESPAFEMISQLNQVGSFNRVRADRKIQTESLEGNDRQRAQIERDLQNVTWLGDAGDELCRLLDASGKALDGGPKMTRNKPAPKSAGESRERQRVWAVVPVNEISGLGASRDLAEPIAGTNAVRRTLERLARCNSLEGAVLVGTDRDRVASLAGIESDRGTIDGLDVRVVEIDAWTPGRARAVGASRAFAPGAWRGGVGGLSAYDEVLDPLAADKAVKSVDADAVLLVGADWCLVDPDLVDACAERFESDPERNNLCFTQCPPGLGACLLSASLAESFAANFDQAGVMGTVGGVLGYHPAMKQADPIAQSGCVTPDASVRNLNARLIADSAAGRGLIEQVFRAAGDDARAIEICAATREAQSRPVEHVTIDAGAHDRWLEPEAIAEVISDSIGRGMTAVTIRSDADPARHPSLSSLIRSCRDAGATAVHVRTPLIADEATLVGLVSGEDAPDVISADLFADDELTFMMLTGRDDFHTTRRTIGRMIEARELSGGLAFPWIAPRITRCDTVYEQIEGFYDSWLRAAGACVIDPLTASNIGERIEPLPLPLEQRVRLDKTSVTIDGTTTTSTPRHSDAEAIA